MGKEKKIGLITIYHVPNYGSVLQAYATQKILENAGATCSMLNYRYPNEWHIRKDSLRKRSLKAKVALLLGLKSAHRKSKKLSSFRKKYYHFTKEYESLDALKKEDWSGYDAFCVGSDQVWNSRFTLGDSAFMLSFVPDDKFKFSLASSFSANIVPMDFKEKYRKFLAKFDVLSVREQNGNDIVENDLKLPQKAQVVLDPTLLLNKAEWLEEFPVKEEAKEKYILVYVLTYAFESRPYVYEVIKYFQEKYNYKVIALEGYARPQDCLGIHMIDKTDSDIPQFMSLFANAEMVVTTSFHGTAFAVNFGKPLISIVPQNTGDDRQSSLLKAIGLEQVITPVGKTIGEINPYYDAKLANTKLDILRQTSLRWIKETMNLIQTKR